MRKEVKPITAYKDKQFIIFDFEDGKTVQYDLATKQTIGKTGRIVQDLRSQLRGYTIEEIIDSFADENYQNYLKYVRRACGYSISNVGTLIEKAKSFGHFEQFFSAGLTSIDADFKYKINETPAGLIKLCRKNELRLTNRLYQSYITDPDFFNVAFEMNFIGLEKNELLWILISGGEFHWRTKEWHDTYIHRLHHDNNYNIKTLLTYLDNLKVYEALDEDCLIREFYDYVNMMNKLSPKFEKYPKNFLTTHRIAARNYNRLKQQFEEEDFKKKIDTELEYSCDDFKIIYPQSTQDIKDEAVQQGNCVASYIKDVLAGHCHILFLRKKDQPDKSLVTLEIRNNKVVQAKGKFNRDVTEEEQAIIDKYNQVLEREIAC